MGVAIAVLGAAAWMYFCHVEQPKAYQFLGRVSDAQLRADAAYAAKANNL